MTNSKMSSKTAFVTGASRGIGLTFVKQLLDRGFRVAAGCRNPDSARDLNELLKSHPNLYIVKYDATNDVLIKEAGLKTTEIFPGGLDLLINNAGIGTLDSLATTTRQSVLEVADTNIAGPLITTQAFTELLKKSQHPIVLNVSSRLGSIGLVSKDFAVAYRMSKAGLNMLSKIQAVSDLGRQIVFISVHPGHTNTDMGRSVGFVPPLSADDSVSGMLKYTIDRVWSDNPPDLNGKFVSYEGNTLDY